MKDNDMKNIANLQVEYKPIADLKPYARNARTHSAAQLRMLTDSIRTFGFTNPVLIDADNIIMAGHGRVEAAKQLGMAEVPTIRIDDLTDAQKRAYILADNRLAERAGWDDEMLALELGELIELETDFEITITGFELATIDGLLQDSPPEDPDDQELDPSAFPDMAVSKLGDLWLLGDHRLLCGSALKAEDYETLMDGEKAQMVFTDPPYNVKIQGNVTSGTKHGEFAMASGEMTDPEFETFLADACSLMAQNSVDGSIHFVCMDWRHAATLQSAAASAYSELKNIAVWVKHLAGMGSMYRSQHEMVLVFKNGKGPHINNVELGKHGRYRTNVWQYRAANGHGGPEDLLAMHPTVKPVAMIADAILDCSHRGGLILDPFGGSGSTLMAAERVKRKARLIELDPHYVDTIIRRWQKRTGKDAVHALTGLSFATTAETKEEAGDEGV